MGSFFKGLLCGIGVGFIIAPMRGQEMRRLVSERVQALRGSLPDTVQVQQYGQQISEQATQGASALKDVVAQSSTQVKEKTSGDENVVLEALGMSQRVGKDAIRVTEPPPIQMEKAVHVDEFAPMRSFYDIDSANEIATLNNLLSAIPGMEPEVQRGLEEQGIDTISQLLRQTRTKESRIELAQKVNITTQRLRALVDRADLMRLQGIGGDGATLLEEAGVRGCKDLQHRNAEHLHTTLMEWRESGMAASPIPTLDELSRWIAEAKAVVITAQGE